MALPSLDWQPGPLPDPATVQDRLIIVLAEDCPIPTVIRARADFWEDTATSCCDPSPARFNRDMVCQNQLVPVGKEPDLTVTPFMWSWWDTRPTLPDYEEGQAG